MVKQLEAGENHRLTTNDKVTDYFLTCRGPVCWDINSDIKHLALLKESMIYVDTQDDINTLISVQ